MPDSIRAAVDVGNISIRRKPCASIAVIGNPNAGKSTLFNRLTGLRQTTGNFPGVTVEKHTGVTQIGDRALELVDLPGVYCLGGRSADERIAVDTILGRFEQAEKPDGLLLVVAATHLYQGLYLAEQVLELGLPTMVALTMQDVAVAQGIEIDTGRLSQRLGGIPVCPVATVSGKGLNALKQQLYELPDLPRPQSPESWPQLGMVADRLTREASRPLERMDAIQGLIHPEGDAAQRLNASVAPELIQQARSSLFEGQLPQATEARKRYAWAGKVVSQVQSSAPILSKTQARIQHWINRPWPATILFFLTLMLVFQAVFSWATPLMEFIDDASSALASAVVKQLGESALSSFIADGVISGVGSVIIFLPQILILFLFIILLEDTGYLARAAFLMDRAMRKVGLSGQSVIPMLSSFACAVPSIMATRVIPDRRDRFATILAAPFMTCSARLPVYALLIAAFVPIHSVGIFNLQGLVLFGLYLLGIAGGLFTAWLMKRSALRGPGPQFVIALPEFRRPNAQTVAIKLLGRARVFLKRAGTVIFVVAVGVWALAYFPRMEADQFETSATSTLSIDNQRAAAQMEQSYLGQAGQWVEPVFRPLGWDWKVSSAVIAGFPAREVVVAIMGTLYAVGSDADEASLSEKLKSASWPDGKPIFTLPMVLGLMVFYAWCLQCAATVAIIRRETNSWRWPLFAWSYMSVVAYLGAFMVYQVGTALS